MRQESEALQGLLNAAMNPEYSDVARKAAWITYEAERDYLLVHDGRLRLVDLPPKSREYVYHLIVTRNSPKALEAEKKDG